MQADGFGRKQSNKYIATNLREQPEVNTRIWIPRTPSRTRPVLGKMTGFQGYQTRVSGGKFFFFRYSESLFLKACTIGE